MMKTGRTDFGLFLLPQFLALLCSSYLGYHRDDHNFDWNDHDCVFTHDNDHDDHNHDDGEGRRGGSVVMRLTWGGFPVIYTRGDHRSCLFEIPTRVKILRSFQIFI